MVGALAMVLACGAGVGVASGQMAPPALPDGTPLATVAGQGAGLPFFDVRVDEHGVPKAAVTAKVAANQQGAALVGQTAREADLAALRGMVAGVVVDDDAYFGTPRFVRSTQAFLTPPVLGAKPDAKDVVKGFVRTYPALFEIGTGEIDRARVARDYFTDHNGAHHLTYQQQVMTAKGPVDLFGCEVRANVTKDGALVNVSSTMLPRPEGDFQVPAAKFDDAAAITIAAANVGLVVDGVQPATEAAGASMKRAWQAHPALRSDEPVVTELVYFPLDRDTIHPAWSVVVPVPGDGHTYDTIVDATDGTILWRNDRLVWDSTQPVTYRVYTSDGVAPGSPGTATPTGFQYPVVPRTLLTLNPADVTPYSPNGWIPDGGTTTVGNNVDAHIDSTNTNPTYNAAVTPARPDGGASRVFDFALDPTQQPTTYQSASVVELFWRGNWYHDQLMQLGFNEAAGNFQRVNITGQGVAGDAVQADCQDSIGSAATSSNRNNANFSTTGTDGSTARVQMYVFTGPTPNRDGSLDGDIVYHEFTHGTSIRLHGGLSGTQPGGMGEGWSDFYAFCLLAESTDDPDAVYGTGGYTTYQLWSSTFNTNYYYGIRRYPYSTDLLKNPETFKYIDTAQYAPPAGVPRNTAITSAANEVHNVGEVWCMSLMEMRAQLWHQYGFAGNRRALQLVTDGMKLSVANPTFLQARDAILQADQVDYAGADSPQLWFAFAKRGQGYTATSPSSSTTTGVHEAFDTPIFASFAYPDGLPTTLTLGAPATFRVNITGTNLSLVPGSAQMRLSINGGAFQTLPLTPTATANQYTATIPAQACFARTAFYFTTDTSVGTKTDPAGAPTSVYRTSAIVTGSTTVASDGFETDTGWTVTNVPNPAGSTMTGMWERSTPQATAAQAGAAHGGTLCFVTGASAGASLGANDVDNGTTTLTSPSYNLSGYPDAQVTYWRWYSNGTGGGTAAYTQIFTIDVSTDGGSSWTNAETIGPGSASDPNVLPGWRQGSWAFSSLGLAPTANVKVRFVVQDLIGAVVEAAVDDFAINGLVCTPPTPTGACCAAGACTVSTSAACTTAGGTYQGDNAACTAGLCTPPNYTVSVTVTGNGTVTSTPAGIACGSTCSADFASGTPLTLHAAPASGWAFAGWTGGGCSGTGDCHTTVLGATQIGAAFHCRADFDGSGGTTVQDIFGFLSAWFNGDPRADFNGQDGINVQDIFDFLGAWFGGC